MFHNLLTVLSWNCTSFQYFYVFHKFIVSCHSCHSLFYIFMGLFQYYQYSMICTAHKIFYSTFLLFFVKSKKNFLDQFYRTILIKNKIKAFHHELCNIIAMCICKHSLFVIRQSNMISLNTEIEWYSFFECHILNTTLKLH